MSLANHAASLPVAYRLYLPEDWADDQARRKKAHVPDDVTFKTKPQIALDQIAAMLASGAPKAIVLAGAAYGCNGPFRAGLTRMGLDYCVGVPSNTSVWPPGVEPLPAKARRGRGRKPPQAQHDSGHKPVLVKALAKTLPASAWSEVTWREGSNTPLASRFAALRVRPAPRGDKGEANAPPEWLLMEWPEGEKEPAKYWLSTLPENTPLAVLVDKAKLRWPIERDYEELKSELGLADFEGRSWRGFHHHATLCIASYGFLIRERAAFPPSAASMPKEPAVSTGQRKRGSPCPARTSRRKLNRDAAQKANDCSGKIVVSVPMLSARQTKISVSSPLVTQ